MENSNDVVLDGHLNYDILLKKHPWLIADNQKVIISPDVDGVLCGLFMSFFYNWEIVGYYDGKQLAIKEKLKPSECVFLDMDIYRKNVKSCGHHMVLYNKKKIPRAWDNYNECINPNIIRGHDAYNEFQEKYPLAMIHFLLCVIGSQKKIRLPKTAVSPLLYVDGTFKNLLNYPENCISWLKFFNAKDSNSPIYPIYIPFANRKMAHMIHDLEIIFEKFKEMADGKRGGDKIRIAYVLNGSFTEDVTIKIQKLINLLANFTEWEYKSAKWALNGLNVIDYTKGIEENLNNGTYEGIISKNPISWAITATKRMEYTLEEPNKF